MAIATVTDENGKKIVLASSNDTIKIEGNHYFPMSSVQQDMLVDSSTHTTCFWKGEATYKTVKAGSKEYQDAAFIYPEPMEGALDRVGKDFSTYYAFWQGVEIED